MKFTTTATVIAAALASFADPAQARIGGWNGAAAQAAAMVISGFNGGQLNGPSSGPARMNIRNGPAPIVRVIRDEDDVLGGYRNPVFADNRAHNAREGYTSVPAGGRYDSAYYKRHHNPNHYSDEGDVLGHRDHGLDRTHGRLFEDEDDFLGGYRNPVFANNRAHNAREGYTSVPAGGRYDSAYYKRHHNPNHYADEDDLDYLGNCNDSDWWRHSYCHTRFREKNRWGRDEEEDDSLGHRPTKLCRSSGGRHNECI